MIEQGETAYLWADITNWKDVKNVTFLVFDDMKLIKFYEQDNLIIPGHSALYFFKLNATNTNWCNASISCTENNTELKFLIMHTQLNDFGNTGYVGVIAYLYTNEGKRLIFNDA